MRVDLLIDISPRLITMQNWKTYCLMQCSPEKLASEKMTYASTSQPPLP